MKNLFLLLVFVYINSSVYAQFIDNKIESLMGVHLNNNTRETTSTAGIMSPPSTLVALKGYNHTIPLAWKSPGSEAILGYNIYRSVSAGGTYTKINSDIQRQYYRDETATNGVTYYYKVTTVFSTGESDYSGTVNAKAESDGYTIFSGWTPSAPTLDGVIETSEWSEAVTTNITYPGQSGTVTLYTMNDETHLFLAIKDQRDSSLDNFDGIGVFCDANLDREWPSSSPSSEGLIQQFRNSGASNNSYQGFYGYWPNNYGGDGSTTPSGVNQSISLSFGYVQYEASFDLTTSPIKGSPGDIIGTMFFVYNAGQPGFDGAWPQATTELTSIITGNGWAHAPFSYGDIKLAQDSQVSFWADVDGDGDIDITDVQLVAAHWNLHVYDSNYDSKYDINEDKQIDIVDIQMVAYWWNKPIPPGGKPNKSVVIHSLPQKSAQDLTIRLEPQQSTIKIGDVYSVNVVIENANNLGAFQFNLGYSSDVVQADTAFMGTFLGNTGRTVVPVGPEIDNSNQEGSLTFGGATFGTNAGPDGNGVLSTVEFKTLAAGNTTLQLQNVRIADINGQTININSIVNGEIIVSPAGGNLWTVQVSGTQNKLYAVTAFSNLVAWTVGVNGTVLRTTDGGNAWTNVSNSSTPFLILDVEALDANTALIAPYDPGSNNALIYRTNNGGLSWTNVFQQTNGFINNIKMFSQNEGIALGDPASGVWTILKTTDGGNNWTAISNPPAAMAGDYSFLYNVVWTDQSTGWFGTNKSKLFHTSNGGTTWDERSIQGLPNVNSIAFNQAGVGLAEYYQGQLVRTFDGGVNWQAISPPGAGTIRFLLFYQNKFWLLRANSIYSSADNGSTWEVQTVANANLRHLSFVTNQQGTYGWAVGDNGVILRYKDETANAVLSVNPALLDFGASATSKTFDISNAGSGDLTWNVGENESWITSVSPTNGSDNATVTVSVDRSGLGPGDYSGKVTVTSNGGTQDIAVKVNVGAASNNILVNGNFSNGDTGWILWVDYRATANGAVQNGEYAVSITNGSNVNWHIQLMQTQLLIENGKTYSVSFEAYAASPRQINSYVKKDSAPNTIYSNWEHFSLTTTKQMYNYTFTMNDPTDSVAALTFELGNSTVDVYLDNIMLTVDDTPTDVEAELTNSTRVPANFRLLQNYPNPFNPETRISYELSKQTKVVLKIRNLLGQEVRTLVDADKPAGFYEVTWDGKDASGQKMASGVYVYRLETQGFVQSRKMVLLQ